MAMPTMMSDWGLGALPPPTKQRDYGQGAYTALGVDYGTVNIGVGVSSGFAPRPLLTIKHSGNDKEVSFFSFGRLRGGGGTC